MISVAIARRLFVPGRTSWLALVAFARIFSWTPLLLVNAEATLCLALQSPTRPRSLWAELRRLAAHIPRLSARPLVVAILRSDCEAATALAPLCGSDTKGWAVQLLTTIVQSDNVPAIETAKKVFEMLGKVSRIDIPELIRAAQRLRFDTVRAVLPIVNAESAAKAFHYLIQEGESEEAGVFLPFIPPADQMCHAVACADVGVVREAVKTLSDPALRDRAVRIAVDRGDVEVFKLVFDAYEPVPGLPNPLLDAASRGKLGIVEHIVRFSKLPLKPGVVDEAMRKITKAPLPMFRLLLPYCSNEGRIAILGKLCKVGFDAGADDEFIGDVVRRIVPGSPGVSRVVGKALRIGDNNMLKQILPVVTADDIDAFDLSRTRYVKSLRILHARFGDAIDFSVCLERADGEKLKFLISIVTMTKKMFHDAIVSACRNNRKDQLRLIAPIMPLSTETYRACMMIFARQSVALSMVQLVFCPERRVENFAAIKVAFEHDNMVIVKFLDDFADPDPSCTPRTCRHGTIASMSGRPQRVCAPLLIDDIRSFIFDSDILRLRCVRPVLRTIILRAAPRVSRDVLRSLCDRLDAEEKWKLLGDVIGGRIRETDGIEILGAMGFGNPQ